MRNLGEYDLGSYKIVRITFQVQDLTTLVWSNEDPTAVTHDVETPDGVKRTYLYGTDVEIVREARGVYHHGLSLDQEKRWRGHWDGTGTVQEPSNWYLTVDPNPLA